MDITKETEDQTRERLLSVLRAADVTWLPGDYAFEESSELRAVVGLLEQALAVVRDGDGWSVLSEATEAASEVFRIFTCHFDSQLPNSGFVGWLATELKRNLGTGVFVVCGQNSNRGGIFDYWGVPAQIGAEAAELLMRLREAS